MTFDPASLFAAAQAGGWFDPSDLSTLWQDTAATIPVTSPGQPVARIDDKSGNGNHMTQAAAASMPSYQLDSQGNSYLLFDGADDFISSSLAPAMPFDRISAIRQVSWGLNDRIFSSANEGCRLFQNSASPQLRIYAGSSTVVANGDLAVGKNGIVTERLVANAGQLAVDNRPYVSGDFGSTAPTSLVVGGRATGASAANIRLYGLIIRAGSLTDEEIAGARDWLASRSGVSLLVRRAARHSWWS